MNKLYRIGFDIGVGSVGWAVLQNNSKTEEPDRILKLGVRTFSANEVPKGGGSTAATRRELRGARRRRRRKQHREERVRNLLAKTFNLEIDKELAKLINDDVYKLRVDALDFVVTDAQLAKIVLNILKHRGFESNRKNGKNDSEDGKLLSAIKENASLMQQSGWRTIGEFICKDDRFKAICAGHKIYNVRNHNGDYKNCFDRNALAHELEMILKAQQRLGNDKISNEFIENVVAIFKARRSFDEGPGSPSPYSAKFDVGRCTFMPEEERAPKASYTFELFNALSKINNLKVNDEDLTTEQKQILVSYVQNKGTMSFTQARKLLNLPLDKTFNLCRYINKKVKSEENISEEDFIKACEKVNFVNLNNSFSIAKVLGFSNPKENEQVVDEVALMLSKCKSGSTIDDYILSSDILKELTEEQKVALKYGLSFEKFGSLSIKAMRQIMPYLKQGLRYDKACKSAGFNHSSFEHEKSKFLKGAEIEERLKDITSPVVKRAVNQTIRILNEIIKEYGSPQFVSMELARDLAKIQSERKKIENRQHENFEKNEIIRQQLRDDHKLVKPTASDVLKFKLYQEQEGKCIYSGKVIDISRLFEPNYVQIDHILPISRSFDDSYNNKVLVIAGENQNKQSKTPYEWLGHDDGKWNEFVNRVNLLKNRTKKQNLLKTNFSDEQSQDFISRNLNDTRYISKFLLDLFKDFLLLTPSKTSKKQVRSLNGAATSYLRKCWAINKLRDDGDIHHCVDAAIIATVSDGQVQKITAFNKLKENYKYYNGNFINKQTKEIIDEKSEQEFKTLEINEKLADRLPLPYPGFAEELMIRSSLKYTDFNFTDQEKDTLVKLGYSRQDVDSIRPVFISRMKTVKHTGAIHKDTLLSAREYKETGNLIKSKSIYELDVKKVPEKVELKNDPYPQWSIPDYYRPSDDRLLYLKLKSYLVENGCKIDKNIVFYKPKADGSDGPVVKKVKVYEKTGSCVITPNGAAANDMMHRVDVYEKDGKYYLCPVYMSDVYAKKLPNKVVVQNKPWLTIDKSFKFLFSLYQNDLIKVTHKNNIVLNKNFKSEKSLKEDEISNEEFLLYYNSTGIFGASIELKTHDNCYKINSLGVKTLKYLEKYYVDIMGNIYKANKEERKKL